MTASADAHVVASKPKTNTGSSKSLRVQVDPEYRSYLGFDLRGLQPIASAVLRLYTTTNSAIGYEVRGVESNSWHEHTINFSNAPPMSPTALSSGPISRQKWIDIDVTELVVADAEVSLGVTTASGAAIYFKSRENPGLEPHLVVTTGPADSSPPTTPSSLRAIEVGPTHVQLAWSPSEDDTGVTSYGVRRDGVVIAAVEDGTRYSDRDVLPERTYTYTVAARDSAGNVSAESDPLVVTTPAAPPVDRLLFTPVADTHVDSSRPDSSFGTAASVWIDAVPRIEAFVRFDVAGISGRTVTAIRLRLYQTDASDSGGRVRHVESNGWTEGMTWNTRPAMGPDVLATSDGVEKDRWYELRLPMIVSGDGPVSLGIDSTSADGARWASRESVNPPQLIVEVERAEGLTLDGISKVATEFQGSSDPTMYASNRRVATTEGGRLLAIHGRHARGVQLAWRDPGSGWDNRTRGEVSDGLLLRDTGSGDWTASIAAAPDGFGEEHAWVVWAGPNLSTARPLQMRRLSELDSPDGPLVGPVVSIDAPAMGTAWSDITFERGSGGDLRGAIVWTRRVDSSLFEVATTWFTDLLTDTPATLGTSVVLSATSQRRVGTLVAVDGGTRLIVRGNSGRLRIYAREATDPLGTWRAGVQGAPLATLSRPGAAALASGEVLAVGEADTATPTVVVERFSADAGSSSTVLELPGYSQPSVASAGQAAWVVAIRNGDGAVVSWTFSPWSGWSDAERIEIVGGEVGTYAWPNLVRVVDDRLRFIVAGASGTLNRRAVLAYQRPIGG